MKKKFNFTLRLFFLISFGIHVFFIFLSHEQIYNKPPGHILEVNLINWPQKKQSEVLEHPITEKGERPTQEDVAAEEKLQKQSEVYADHPGRQVVEKENVSFVESRDNFFLSYLQLIQKKIESQRKYPKEAIEKKEEGTAYIKFTILPSGDVSEIAIVNSSGSSVLDEAAIIMVKDANPFPTLPQDSPLSVKLPITFKIMP